MSYASHKVIFPGAQAISLIIFVFASAQCKSVWKAHTNLPDTPVNLASALNPFQMLPDPPAAK